MSGELPTYGDAVKAQERGGGRAVHFAKRWARAFGASCIFFATAAHADAPETPRGAVLLDRTTPQKEKELVLRGSEEQRSLAIERAAFAAVRDDEALALLVYAVEHAREVRLRADDPLLIAHGLASRGETKLARDALFALLNLPLDSRAAAQSVAVTALARVSHVNDPPEGTAEDRKKRKPEPTTLERLLRAASSGATQGHIEMLSSAPANVSSLPAMVSTALVRYPPRAPLPRLDAPGMTNARGLILRTAAATHDLRMVPEIERTLADSNLASLHPLALDAVTALGDARSLPRVTKLATERGARGHAAMRAWLALDPRGAEAALRARLAAAPTLEDLLLAARVPALRAAVAARALELPQPIPVLAALPGAVSAAPLRTLAQKPEHLHSAIDALRTLTGKEAGAALDALMGADAYAVSAALLERMLAGGKDAAHAESLLRAHGKSPLTVVAATLRGAETTEAQRIHALWTHLPKAPIARRALAGCARALTMLAPACAYAYGRGMPRTPREDEQHELRALLAIPDVAVRVELHRGLAESAWQGRTAALTRALLSVTEIPGARALARLAHQRPAVPSATAMLQEALRLRAAGEPDAAVARALAGDTNTPTLAPRLLRAQHGAARCGYVHDDHGVVRPFVIEQGLGVVTVTSDRQQLTFTPCLEPTPADPTEALRKLLEPYAR